MKQIPINAYDDGTSLTIKAQYYKTSLANFTRGGQRFCTVGVLEVPDDCEIESINWRDFERLEEQ